MRFARQFTTISLRAKRARGRYIQFCSNSRGRLSQGQAERLQSMELGGRIGRELVHLDDTRETGRLLSRYCSMYNNLGAAQRRTPFASPRTAANLIPRGGSGRERMVSCARFTRGIALCGGSSRWRRSGDRSVQGEGGYRQKDLHGGSTASQIT